MNNKFTLLFIVISCFFVSSAFAAGTLIGVVSDSLSGFDLPGANIQISGTAMGASTDLNGEYRISSIPAGSYEVLVSYIGYQSKRVNVDIADGETKVLSIVLFPEAIEGEVIVVTAQARGQQQAINQQLASDKVANIVSEQRIQELPDFNAAAALSRLPGISTQKSSGEDSKVIIRGLSPKYNSIEIEGVSLSATGSSSIGLTSDTYVTTGGVQNDRSVDLTMVSPYMIRTIAVYKSLTPDMNANSIGGTVNMELREAPEEMHFDALYQQGYTAKSNTYGNLRAVISGSKRFLDNKLGIYALGNYETYDRNADNLDANYNVVGSKEEADSLTGNRPVLINTVTLNRHLESRERFGGNLIMDYRLPKGSIKFVNMFARLNSDYVDHRQTINYDQGRLQWRMQDGENIVDQRMHSLKLDYDFNLFTTDLSLSYTGATNKLENSPVVNFGQFGVDVNKEDSLHNRVPEDMVFLIDYLGDNEVTLFSGNLFSNEYQEDNTTIKTDFNFPFNIGSQISGSFKFGGQYTKKAISTNQESPYLGFDGNANSDEENIANDMMKAIQSKFDLYVNESGMFTGTSLKNADNDVFKSFLKDKYGDIYYASDNKHLMDILDYIVGNPSFDASDADLSDGRNGGWYDGPYQKLTNDYEYNEDYYAGYAMTKFNVWDFMVLGGARYEKVESDYFAYNAMDMRNAQLQRMYDTTSVSENDFLLPMMQAKYSPFDWMDVRYAYTQTLSRPDYHMLSPKFTITQNGTIHTGNSGLKPAHAFNHDISFTFHSNKLGLLTVGGFYKTIKDFVYQAPYSLNWALNFAVDSLDRYTVVDTSGGGITPRGDLDYRIYRPFNNPNDAYVKGIELDFQHNFWYLPSPFNGMVFGLNYARIFSKTKYPFAYTETKIYPRPIGAVEVYADSTAPGSLIDQPDHVLNSYIGIDYKGFSARLSFLFTDNSARYIEPKNPENNSFTEAYFRMDFSARQKLPWLSSELFLDVANLNDQKDEWTQSSTGGYQGIRNYGLTANFGLRIRY
ncbi:MAG: TonB-dependent receptor [Calditrichaceae bacterium]|nr:TonB-dependent receptor [Calditrichaceae bacterium]